MPVLTLEKGLQLFVAKAQSLTKNNAEFFSTLSTAFLRDVNLMFRGEGSRTRANANWAPFSPRTLHPVVKGKIDTTRWNIRRGTDGSRRRRYSENSKLLRASGGFQKSFRAYSDDKSATVETNHVLAKEIMTGRKGRTRRLIMFTSADAQYYNRLWRDYLVTKIRGVQ